MRNLSIIIIIAAIAFSSCNNSAPKEEKGTSVQAPSPQRSMDARVFQCSMHPHIIKDAAGKCPVCGMELEQKSYHEALMFLSDYKKNNPDYRDGDEILKDLGTHDK